LSEPNHALIGPARGFPEFSRGIPAFPCASPACCGAQIRGDKAADIGLDRENAVK